MTRKIAFVIVSFVVFILLIFIFTFLSSFKKPAPSPDSSTPSTTPSPTNIPLTDEITISNIPVKNFYKKAEKIDNAGNVYFVDEPNKYQILYEEKFDQFLISILGSPFEELRIEAEQKLISDLGITTAEACLLNVVITTPAFANPDFSGKPYKLSFCE